MRLIRLLIWYCDFCGRMNPDDAQWCHHCKDDRP